MFNHVRKATSADVDSWAASFESLDGSTTVPMSTTKAFAARIVSLKARVAELEGELDSWPLHGEGRLTKAGWELAQTRYQHVCETIEEFRGYWTELQTSKALVAELEEPQVGLVECPNCNEEHTVQLSRGQTNDPNKSGEGGSGS